MRGIKEPDWKLVRRLHSQALERLCKQILLELEQVTTDHAKTFHQRYISAYELLQRRDKELASVFDDLRGSTALIKLAAMKYRDLLTEDEFSQVSEETRESVRLLVRN
jgi:hypothetical protein